MSKHKDSTQQFIFICNGKDCKKNGCKELQKVIKHELKQKKKLKSVKLIKTKCTGKCKQAPVLIADNQWFTKVSPDDALRITHALIEKEEILEKI
ncbi:MAG: (2Fe-2S) ferredoxin domain-containing protein [Cyclobacteriaceae bacterium]